MGTSLLDWLLLDADADADADAFVFKFIENQLRIEQVIMFAVNEKYK